MGSGAKGGLVLRLTSNVDDFFDQRALFSVVGRFEILEFIVQVLERPRGKVDAILLR